MIGHKCSKCLWWDNEHKNVPVIKEGGHVKEYGKNPLGFCRKHKPAATMKEGLYMGIWPLTDENDFCGEFREDS